MRAILILNLGTPAEPTARGLRNYYRRFFADPFVFDIPPLGRWLLRNFIVIPFRAPKTAEDYKTIWLDGGSPLWVYSSQLRDRLQENIDPSNSRILVRLGMGYSDPLITDTLRELNEKGVRDILVMPLFPQYSTATTGSVLHAVEQAVKKWREPPRLSIIKDLFSESAFVRAWVSVISRHLVANDQAGIIDHVIFSYHGLPVRNITKADTEGFCKLGSCCDSLVKENRYCYRAQCMETTRLIANAMHWSDDYYSIAFQSRFGKQPWTEPYLDQHLEQLAAAGKKRVAVLTPSFVSDCLETLHEIGIEYRDLFIEKGGEDLVLIPNLNNEEAWFNSAQEILENHLSRSVMFAPKQPTN